MKYIIVKKITTGMALILGIISYSQVGVDTNTPNTNADLDLAASNKALYLNRVANTGAIADPQPGMMIYDLTDQCVKGYQGSPAAWTGCFRNSASAKTAQLITVGYTKDGWDFVNNNNLLISQLDSALKYDLAEKLKKTKSFTLSDINVDLSNTDLSAIDFKGKYDVIISGKDRLSPDDAVKMNAYIDAGGIVVSAAKADANTKRYTLQHVQKIRTLDNSIKTK
ncbi:hypothetical protein GCM10023210_35420 [Chryseobacterium ginsengisoli]|uniref:Uncharacterized protein n=1 Tax=Chryseobacterium ginsengisoli TaxID=363853 RepID=A0ABP9MQA7_9FLAO